ncbi:transposase [Peptoniphilus raoultii]|uniref:transposase n=1 Tax=Peptoniphilus raoultii TaxID=1776387 RepID=UPI0008D99659|nr:transposase [Peptoniphilus raoultii]
MARAKFKEWLEEEKLILINGWAKKGLTEEQISKNMGISYSTLREWKKKYPAIETALKKGKEVVDYEVESALFKRAMGYEYEEEKTYIQEVDGKVTKRKEITKKHMPGDTTAQIFWLKNRKPEEWRDRPKISNESMFSKLDEVLASIESGF